MRINIHIATRDRPSELALLLESLRKQTYQDFDIFILEDCSGTPLQNYHFINCVIHRLQQEGHNVEVKRTPFNYGVSKSRQELVEWSMKENNNPLILRVDDDILLEADYIEKLFDTLKQGWDLVSGITPPALSIPLSRETKFVKPIINEVQLNEKGEFIRNCDDCGCLYLEDEIIPTHHFRSCALYKKEIHEAGVNYKSNLSKHGFREEEIFSFKCMMKGFKMAVRTGAVVQHLLTPGGGERFSNSQDLINLNEEILVDWVKEQYKNHGNFITEYNKKLNLVPNDRKNPTNLILGGRK